MDCRLKNVLEAQNKSSRKRQRRDDSDDEETVPSIFLVREEIKAKVKYLRRVLWVSIAEVFSGTKLKEIFSFPLKHLEEEKAQLEEELESLKCALKASSKAIKTTQEENSKLVFDLASSYKLLDEMKKDKVRWLFSSSEPP